MARFKIQASWNYSGDEGHVDYQFSRHEQMSDAEHARQVAHAHALGRSTDVNRAIWRHLGDAAGPLCTAIEADRFAMAWLVEHAGMVDADSTRMHLFTSGALEQIEALAAAAR